MPEGARRVRLDAYAEYGLIACEEHGLLMAQGEPLGRPEYGPTGRWARLRIVVDVVINPQIAHSPAQARQASAAHLRFVVRIN